MGSPSKRDDRGETLIELLVAVVVMGTAIVAILGAMATAIRVSELHRRQAEAGAYIKEFAETLENQVALSNYQDCGGAAYYEAFYPERPAPFRRKVVAVTYWNGTDFAATCSSDLGVQQISLRVWTVEADRPTITENLSITIRKPCRPEDALCG